MSLPLTQTLQSEYCVKRESTSRFSSRTIRSFETTSALSQSFVWPPERHSSGVIVERSTKYMSPCMSPVSSLTGTSPKVDGLMWYTVRFFA